MEFTAQQIADQLGGELMGDPTRFVDKLVPIESGVKGALSFVSDPKYLPQLEKTKASVVIIDASITFPDQISNRCTVIKVKDARLCFAKILSLAHAGKHSKTGLSEHTFVHDDAKIGSGVYLGHFCSVEEGVTIGQGTKIYDNVSIAEHCSIGKNCIIYPGVRIYSDTVIGNDCTIHSNAVIGSDGFGFAPGDDKHYFKVVHIGNVIIDDHVEIGSGTTIDRGTLGSTILRKGVKLDNLIQIAHNVDIGENTVIAAQTGIAGSTKIGRNCMIGGQVGIIGHIEIADGTKIAAQSGVAQSIETPNRLIMGSPAMDKRTFQRAYLALTKLPETMERIKNLENRSDHLNSERND